MDLESSVRTGHATDATPRRSQPQTTARSTAASLATGEATRQHAAVENATHTHKRCWHTTARRCAGFSRHDFDSPLARKINSAVVGVIYEDHLNSVFERFDLSCVCMPSLFWWWWRLAA